MTLTNTPKNIAIPPISGTEPVCGFRLLGLSTRLILIAKGRSKNITIKVVIEAINIGNIGIFKKNLQEIDKPKLKISLTTARYHIKLNFLTILIKLQLLNFNFETSIGEC